MLIDVIAGAPDLLLILAVSVSAACILHLVARDIERARWQREFGGWRTLQQDRIDHGAQYRMVLFPPAVHRNPGPAPLRARLCARLAARSASPHRPPAP